MDDQTICPACFSPKPKNRRLCHNCYMQYGNSVSDFPEWLQFIIRDNDRLRKQEQEIYEHEVPLDEYEPDDDGELDADLDDPLWTRGEMRREGFGLPYAPYADEEMNRAYRKANGFPDLHKKHRRNDAADTDLDPVPVPA